MNTNNHLRNFLISILVFLVLALLFVIHFSLPSTKEQTKEKESADYFEKFIAGYESYSFSKFEEARKNLLKAAEEMHKEDFAKGETEDKFEGANVFVYCYKATDEEKITDEEMLALFLPVLLVILAVIALYVSINFGLSAMRRLDFNNEATEFKN